MPQFSNVKRMPLIELDRISRSYGPLRALDGVTLTLEPGTIGLVGNNGAGKSTLLKILLGLLPPDAGGGTILGHDILRAAHTIRGQVGYMPEAAAVVPTLKGVEFVTLAGDLYGMPHRDARRRAHEVLDYVGLGELRYRRLEEYSTGNVQRLKLAGALVHDPRLLLLDEPTNGLDPEGRAAMLRLIEDLIDETGKSVLLCSHLLTDVQRMCRHIVVIDHGRVLHSGPMSGLKSPAADRFELAFTGPAEPFLEALEQAGVEASPPTISPAGGRLTAAVPPPWPTSRFFSLAQSSGVVLTQLLPQEEDLQGLFFRITGEGRADAKEE